LSRPLRRVDRTTWYFGSPGSKTGLQETSRAILIGGLMVVLLAVALSWRADNRLHVYVLDVDGHPVLVQTPGGKQVLIGGSNSPSGLLSALGKLLPFWDRDIDLLVVPQAGGDQLNGRRPCSIGMRSNRSCPSKCQVIIGQGVTGRPC
jgi:hypothetical protein